MKYTSLTHNKRGYNTQLDYSSIESWEDYINQYKVFSPSEIVWSRLFCCKTGRLVKSYFREESKQ